MDELKNHMEIILYFGENPCTSELELGLYHQKTGESMPSRAVRFSPDEAREFARVLNLYADEVESMNK